MAAVEVHWPLSPTGLGLIHDYVLSHMTYLEGEEQYLSLEPKFRPDSGFQWMEKTPDDYLNYFLPPPLMVNQRMLTTDLKGGLCPICWELFQTGDSIYRLKCSHFYHQTCLDKWWRNPAHWEGLNCPYCRQSQYEGLG